MENIYGQFPGQPVAFIDEAYRGFERPGEKPFYIATAVVVSHTDLATVRKELFEIAGDRFWHTSEALRTDAGRERAVNMLDYLAEGPEPCIVASKVEIARHDRNLEQARRDCLRALLCALSEGIENVTTPVNVVVIEKRNTPELVHEDKKTHSGLISDGALPRHHRLVQASPADDRLLWLPDVVSSAVRRSLAFNDKRMYDHIGHRIHFIRA
ncbi:hypothetical protein ACLTEW_24310 [Gordonia lacunae]|uniref:hypothetical protein n=1 Tax=Gordonia TaxID=2053 RepID=UPI00200B2871|nr:hypothetical protein [Gordonia terrae]UPW11992.1 hypothetical protein M1C59_25410 [Gordonia terrae]